MSRQDWLSSSTHWQRILRSRSPAGQQGQHRQTATVRHVEPAVDFAATASAALRRIATVNTAGVSRVAIEFQSRSGRYRGGAGKGRMNNRDRANI